MFKPTAEDKLCEMFTLLLSAVAVVGFLAVWFTT